MNRVSPSMWRSTTSIPRCYTKQKARDMISFPDLIASNLQVGPNASSKLPTLPYPPLFCSVRCPDCPPCNITLFIMASYDSMFPIDPLPHSRALSYPPRTPITILSRSPTYFEKHILTSVPSNSRTQRPYPRSCRLFSATQTPRPLHFLFLPRTSRHHQHYQRARHSFT